jgi:hypothetical protein
MSAADGDAPYPGCGVLSQSLALQNQTVGVSAVWSFPRSGFMRSVCPSNLGISARSAAVSAIVVLFALTLAGAGLDTILYRSLLAAADAAAGRVRDIAGALQSNSINDLDSTLLNTNQRVVAIQLIAPDVRRCDAQ